MSEPTTTTTTPAAPAAKAPTQSGPDGLADLIRNTIVEGDAKAATPKQDTAPVEQKAAPVQQAKAPFVPPIVAQKPKEAAPAEVDPLETIEPDKGTTEAAKANFAKLREAYKASKTERSTYQKQLVELQQQLEQTKKSSAAAPTADYETLKAEHQKVLDHLAKVDLQNHPDFVAKYVAPKQAALSEAQEVLSWNDKKVDLTTLLGKSPKELSQALADVTKGMNSVDAATVIQAVRTASKLDQGAAEQLKNAKATADQLGQRAAYQNRTEFESVWKESGIGEFLGKHEISADLSAEDKAEAEAYNQGIDSIRQNAEKYAFGNLAPRDVASVAQKAAFADFVTSHAFPAVGKAMAQMQSQIQTLTQELTAIRSSRSPGVPTAPAQSAAPTASNRYGGNGLAQEDMAETLAKIMRNG